MCFDFLSSVCGCMSSCCSCCANTCFCLTACSICCNNCSSERQSGSKTHSSPALRTYSPLKLASKVHIQDVMKTLMLTRNHRSKSDIEGALQDGEMGFSRPIQLLKWLSDDRITVAIYSFQFEIVIAFHVDATTDHFLQSTSCDPVRFVDAIGVAGRVHDGVLQEWNPICEQVQRQIQLFVRDNPSGLVTMAGYGPGGAIASLNAIYTQTQLFLSDRLRLMTFGGIRFATRKMRDAAGTLLSGNSFDFISGADPIYARKRYATLGSKYFRIGQLIHIRPDDEYRAYDRYWTNWERMRQSSDPDQHDLERYQIEIEAWNGNVIRIPKSK